MGSTFTVSGRVTLDTGPATAGAKQVGSEIEKMSKTGIAGFEAAQQKVIDLTKRMGELRNELLKTNDPAAQTKLNAALSQTQTQLRAAKNEFRGMTLETREANEKAQLLAGTFGIQIPAGLGKLIAKSEGAQKVLEASFGIGIVAGFGAAIVAMAVRGVEAIKELTDTTGVFNGVIQDAAKGSDKALVSFTKISDGVRLIAESNRQLLQVQTRVSEAFDAPLKPNVGILAVLGPLGGIIESYRAWERRKETLNQLGKEEQEILNRVNGQLARQNDLIKKNSDLSDLRAAQHAAFTAGLDTLGRAKAELDFLKQQDKDMLANAALTNEERARQHELMTLRMATAEEDLNQAIQAKNKELTATHAAEVKKRASDFEEASKRMDAATLHNVETVLAGIKRQEEMVTAGLDAETAVRQAGLADAQKAAGIWNKSMEAGIDIQREAAAKAKEQFDKVSGSIESFIDRVFLQAKSIADVFHQFLMQMLGSLVKFISRSIAASLLGMKQVSGGGAGGSGLGGIAGSILGGIFGGGAGGSGLGAGGSSFLPTASGLLPTSFAGLGLAASGGGFTNFGSSLPADFGVQPLGAAGGGIPNAAGGATSGILGKLAFGGKGLTMADLAGLLGVGGILGGGALVSNAFGSGSILKGALGGAATGLGIGALFAAGGAFGPAGLAIAGIAAAIGALIGWMGQGRAKRKASQLEQGFEFAAIDLLDEYKKGNVDYQSALDQMRTFESQGRDSLLHAGLGKSGQRGADNLTMVIEEQIRQLKEIEDQRQARQSMIAGMPLPEFALGGPVGSRQWAGGSQGLLALLHPGEFVMRKSAVDALGSGFLSALNRAPRFDAGGVVGVGSRQEAGGRGIHIGAINVYPQIGMSDRQASAMVVRGLRRASQDGAL